MLQNHFESTNLSHEANPDSVYDEDYERIKSRHVSRWATRFCMTMLNYASTAMFLAFRFLKRLNYEVVNITIQSSHSAW